MCSRTNQVQKLAASVRGQYPLIIAHRGASKAKRENTLEAFQAAIEMGADGIEFDVRRTMDGAFVVHHDSHIKNCPVLISEQTYDEAEKAAGQMGFHLPTLEETLELCRGRAFVDAELKEQGYEEEVVSFIRQRVETDKTVITSFNDESVKRIKSVWPEVKTGLIVGVDSPASVRTRFSEILPKDRLRRCGADFVVAHYRLVRFGFIRRMKKAGYPVWVWTVNDQSRAAAFVRQGAAAIITDDPDTVINRSGHSGAS